jgi:hypothetical protein
MLVITGLRVYYRTLATGVFHCERCGGDRPYRQRSGRRWAHLLGLPIVPLDRTGEHLRCTICRTCYRVELLAVPTVEEMRAALLAATTSATLAMLAAGGVASQAARRRAIELIMTAGAPQFSDADLVLALAGGDLHLSQLGGAQVPGLKAAVETFAIQLETPAKEWFLSRIVQVGLTDGPLSVAERVAAGSVAHYLGLSPAQAQDVIALTEEAAQAG